MLRRWALVVGDFRREYRMDDHDLARLTVGRFMVLVRGLSADSRLLAAWRDEPKTLHDPNEIEALTRLARA